MRWGCSPYKFENLKSVRALFVCENMHTVLYSLKTAKEDIACESKGEAWDKQYVALMTLLTS